MDAFRVSPLTKALTNKLYKVEVSDAFLEQLASDSPLRHCRHCVVRIFSPRISLSLAQLLSVYRCFADSGLGTPILGEFHIGQIEHYIAGRDLSDDELRADDAIMAGVAAILRRIHAFEPSGFERERSAQTAKLRANLATAVELFDAQVAASSALELWQFVGESEQVEALDGNHAI